MGDYNKLIVSCTVDGSIKKELKRRIAALDLRGSAYQSQEQIVSIEKNKWQYQKGSLNIIVIGQTKYGIGQDDFCEWLRPHVIQGSGDNDVFAMSFSEYSDLPTIWKLGRDVTKISDAI